MGLLAIFGIAVFVKARLSGIDVDEMGPLQWLFWIAMAAQAFRLLSSVSSGASGLMAAAAGIALWWIVGGVAGGVWHLISKPAANADDIDP